MESISDRLRWIADTGGITVSALAVLAGYDPSYGTIIGNGKRDSVSVETTRRLAAIAEVTPGWLAFGDEPVPDEHHVRAVITRAVNARRNAMLAERKAKREARDAQ